MEHKQSPRSLTRCPALRRLNSQAVWDVEAWQQHYWEALSAVQEEGGGEGGEAAAASGGAVAAAAKALQQSSPDWMSPMKASVRYVDLGVTFVRSCFSQPRAWHVRGCVWGHANGITSVCVSYVCVCLSSSDCYPTHPLLPHSQAAHSPALYPDSPDIAPTCVRPIHHCVTHTHTHTHTHTYTHACGLRFVIFNTCLPACRWRGRRR